MRRIFRNVPVWLVMAAVVAVVGATCFGQAASKPTTAKAADDTKMSMWELLVKGGPLMIPIAFCSLIGLAIVIERVIALRRRKIIPPRFLTGLKTVYRNARSDRTAGLEYCRANNSPIARVVATGINKFHKGEEVVEKAIQEAGTTEAGKLAKYLRMLYAVGAVAPMLGLLGTVTGMIKAFQKVASAKALGRPEDLATGIYEALVTTFAGLSVAIPVVIFYHYFLSRIERFVSEIDDVSIEFMEHYTAPDTTEVAPRKAPAVTAR